MKKILLGLMLSTSMSSFAAPLKLCKSAFSYPENVEWCESSTFEPSVFKACGEAFFFDKDKVDCVFKMREAKFVSACDDAFSSIDGKMGCL